MHLTDLGKRLSRMFENLFAGGSQKDVARCAFNHGNAEFFLEFFELRGQGGLAHEAGFSGAAEVPGIGKGYEITQITEIHAGILIQ
jgi:hypothetical protein